MGFDFSLLLISVMFVFSFMVFTGSYYVYMVAGLLLVSLVLSLFLFFNRLMLFSFIFMLVYSRRMLLLIMYISAILGDVEVKSGSNILSFMMGVYFLFLSFSQLSNYYSKSDVGVVFTSEHFYLIFGVFLLFFSLVIVLWSLLKKFV